MLSLLIEENSFLRVEPELRSICPDLEVVLMTSDGSLHRNGAAVAIEEIGPDVAWLSFDLFAKNLMYKFADVILQLRSVKWMQTFNAGLERPFYRAIFDQGTRISKSNAQAIAIAEYVVANVLAVFQGVFERKVHQDLHRWQKTSFRELWQTRWLLVGFGNIGREIAVRVKGFDCKVTAVRRTPTRHPDADAIITLADLPAHLPQADVVVLACALNENTRKVADKKFFQAMQKGSVFVNIARGGLVDQEALIAALQSGTPRYAVLDVFDPEPLPQDSPFWGLDNTIVTPHSSYAGAGTNRRGDLLFVENFRRFLSGDPLLNEVRSDADLL